MCGRATYKLTWEEIVALYQLTLFQPPVNTRARFNVCPTTTVDAILDQDGKRRLERMRWGLIPSWWSKPLKEMKLATFNARPRRWQPSRCFGLRSSATAASSWYRAITNGRTRRAANSLGILPREMVTWGRCEPIEEGLARKSAPVPHIPFVSGPVVVADLRFDHERFLRFG
jgi:SOS response associated peptidase (SRAP)